MSVSTVTLHLQAASLAIHWPREAQTQDPGSVIPVRIVRSLAEGDTPDLTPIAIEVEGATLAPASGMGSNWQVWERKADGHRLVRLQGMASGSSLTLQVVPDPEEKAVRLHARWGALSNETGVPLQQGFKQSLRETFESIIYAFFIAIVLRTFLFQAFYIPSASMEPTLVERDRLVANKFIYHFSEPQTQDIIIFRVYTNKRTGAQRLSRPADSVAHNWEVKDYIKRVIALPNQYIMIRDGQVYVDNQPLDESAYLTDEARLGMADMDPVYIPPGYYFVMGDNRGNSKDSRWIGPVPEESVVGKAHFIFWPMDHVTWLR